LNAALTIRRDSDVRVRMRPDVPVKLRLRRENRVANAVTMHGARRRNPGVLAGGFIKKF
jgi:hypothetical protein